MFDTADNGRQMSTIDVLHEQFDIGIVPWGEDLELLNSDKYIIFRNKAAELSPFIREIPDLGTAMANYRALGQTAYSITFNGQNILPDQLFQKSNGAFLSNLKSETGVGFGKQTDIHLIDPGKAPALNIANAVFGIASAATATYYLKVIDDKLSTIENDTRTIINLLERDKRAQIQNDLGILHEIFSEIELIKRNEDMRRSKLDTVSIIARDQGKNILSYNENLGTLLQEYKNSKGKKQKDNADRLEKNYRYYRLSLQVYAMAKIIEIELGNWYDKDHLSNLREDFENKINQFELIHDTLLETIFTTKKEQVSTRLPLVQSQAYQNMGAFVEHTPLARFELDDWLYDCAEKKQKEARQKALSDAFSVLGEKRIGYKGFEKAYSVEEHQSIEPLLEIVTTMESTYSGQMRMIVCGEDVYLEIECKNENPVAPKET